MRLFNIITIVAIFVSVYSSFVAAATIHGNIYDLSLNKISNARVEVNTTPNQNFISKDGGYSFEIPDGFYIIKAEYRQNGVVATEIRNISVSQEGSYVIDLILFPNFDEEDEISEDIEISIPESEEGKLAFVFGLLFLLFLGIIFYLAFIMKKKKKSHDKEESSKTKEMDETDISKIVDIIKQEGGRATQKEIRKQIPLSEAKVSLMIAELEHKGLIEKIKKGRGNILVLKNK